MDRWLSLQHRLVSEGDKSKQDRHVPCSLSFNPLSGRRPRPMCMGTQRNNLFISLSEGYHGEVCLWEYTLRGENERAPGLLFHLCPG